MKNKSIKKLFGQSGQTLVEYTLVAFILITVSWFSYEIFRDSLGSYFNKVAQRRTDEAGMLP
ncbi:MAG: hypothetical protein A2252_09470 [Elusimicrobia bacterium RIFOXYA2_FULL_39_19]|nr:MAG: hypothetical protein A2252_09470 [Elusimicrobia bacterium RIFOXYA2_FULL_39_19]